MKIPALVPLTTLTAALVTGCSEKKDAAAEPTVAPAAAESRVKHGTNGEVIINLNESTRKALGLEVAALQPASVPPEVKGFGRVLDVSSLASQAADLAAARATAEASQQELARLKTLAAQNNASERALQAAEAAAARDQAQAQAARLRLVANWGAALADRKDLPALISALATQRASLVEIDLPAGEAVKAEPAGARLFSLADESRSIPAQFVGPAPVIDPQTQGRGYLFLVETNAGRLAPGASLTAMLSLPGEAQSGVLVPASAVVRFGGAAWVYLQTTPGTFQRAEVSLERPMPEGWFVRQGVKPQDTVVVVGAQLLLSEELKGEGGPD